MLFIRPNNRSLRFLIPLRSIRNDKVGRVFWGRRGVGMAAPPPYPHTFFPIYYQLFCHFERSEKSQNMNKNINWVDKIYHFEVENLNLKSIPGIKRTTMNCDKKRGCPKSLLESANTFGAEVVSRRLR